MFSKISNKFRIQVCTGSDKNNQFKINKQRTNNKILAILLWYFIEKSDQKKSYSIFSVCFNRFVLRISVRRWINNTHIGIHLFFSGHLSFSIERVFTFVEFDHSEPSSLWIVKINIRCLCWRHTFVKFIISCRSTCNWFHWTGKRCPFITSLWQFFRNFFAKC